MTLNKRIRKVLVANRAEIAVRVIRACQTLGVETVAVFSEADRGSLHTRMANEAVCIGPARATDSYLNTNALISAALATEVDAIHPGYGFLSENAEFAEAILKQNLTFIGPSPHAIRLMKDKMEALGTAKSVGLPILPGSTSPLENADDALKATQSSGYPVLLKAAAGGGGRGLRLIQGPEELKEAFDNASAEARTAFGDGSLYVEKYLPKARHIEVQILSDRHGKTIHLGERECSTQRRYQKMVEEAPSPVVTSKLRKQLTEAAVTLGHHIGYEGAGTVEFLLDEATGQYYFIELNSRIQVEHPVTEMLTGIDIVAQQILIAANFPMAISQKEVNARGHAIECRINAENFYQDFQPSPGTISQWEPPLGPGIRVDTHCYPGCSIPPYYDSLIAKVIAWADTREHAIARMHGALREFKIAGIHTNLPFHLKLLDHPQFQQGQVTTRWVEETFMKAQG